MCRNQKFLHIWHVSDVENVSTYVQFMLFCCKIDFVTICALLSENLFCRDLRTFVWRKNYKYQVWSQHEMTIHAADSDNIEITVIFYRIA